MLQQKRAFMNGVYLSRVIYIYEKLHSRNWKKIIKSIYTWKYILDLHNVMGFWNHVTGFPYRVRHSSKQKMVTISAQPIKHSLTILPFYRNVKHTRPVITYTNLLTLLKENSNQ